MKLTFALVVLLAAPVLAQNQPAAAPGGLFTDLHRNWNSNSPEPNVFHAATNLRCRDDSVPDFITVPHGGEGYPARFCHALNFTSTSPGFSLGNSFAGSPSGWQLVKGLDLTMKVYGAGIKGPTVNTAFCYGIGDCNNDVEMISIGGRTAPSDEGAEALRMTLAEAPYTYSGTVTSDSGVGARRVKTSCPPLSPATPTQCDAQGVGRYLIEEGAVYKGAATAIDYTRGYEPSRLTVTPALPKEMLSTAVGVLTTACLVEQTAANTGTECKFKVKVASGIFKKNYLVAATGYFHNQAQLTLVEGTGDTQTLTMIADHSIPVGAYLYQGREYGDATPSCTGTALELLANTVEKLKFPVDVVGCSAGPNDDSSTLRVAMFLAGQTLGLDMANVVLGTMRVTASLTSDANGSVTLSPEGDAARYIGQTITIGNSRYFSGPCTGVTYSNAGRTITCNQASAGAHTDPDFDRVTLSLGTTGHGNSALVLHRMAEVLDVRNPETLAVDGSFTLEANQMKNVMGTEVEESHYYSQQLQLQAGVLTVFDPYHSQFHSGTATAFTKGAFGPDFVGWRMTNFTPLTGYAGFGGTRFGPDLIRAAGLWNSVLRMDNAPGPSGSTLESVGCPLTAGGCGDTAYSWIPRKFAGNSGEFSERWSPGSNSYLMQIVSKQGYSVFQMNPDNFLMNKPLQMSNQRIDDVAAGVAPNDAATVGQLPLVASFISSGGASDVVNIRGVTGASHCSLTPTNAAAAGNVSSTYISAKTVGRITVSHAAVVGMTYDLLCTSY